jgi:hypothetical protein
MAHWFSQPLPGIFTDYAAQIDRKTSDEQGLTLSALAMLWPHAGPRRRWWPRCDEVGPFAGRWGLKSVATGPWPLSARQRCEQVGPVPHFDILGRPYRADSNRSSMRSTPPSALVVEKEQSVAPHDRPLQTLGILHVGHPITRTTKCQSAKNALDERTATTVSSHPLPDIDGSRLIRGDIRRSTDTRSHSTVGETQA